MGKPKRWSSRTGNVVPLTPPELAQRERDALAYVDVVRADKLAAVRAEAERRIGELFDGKLGMDLVWAEQNMLMRAAAIAIRQGRGAEYPSDQSEAATVEEIVNRIEYIRSREDVCAAALWRCKTLTEIERCEPDW